MSFAIRAAGYTRKHVTSSCFSFPVVLMSRRAFSSSQVNIGRIQHVYGAARSPSKLFRTSSCRSQRRSFSTKTATSHQYPDSEEDDHRLLDPVREKPVSRVVHIKVPRNINLETIDQLTNSEGKTKSENGINQVQENTKSFDQVQPNTQNFTVFYKNSNVTFDVKFEDEAKRLTYHVPNGPEVIEVNIEHIEDEIKQLQKETGKAMEEPGWRKSQVELSKLPQYYMNLSKIRLTVLVVLTTMSGYALAPDPFLLSTFAFCTFGTALTSCAANSINQLLEVPYDSQMNRTKNRVLVKNLLSPLHAVSFAAVTSTTGLVVLYLGANPLTAALGAFNLGLYTMVYTPMKRYSIANTWVGSVVGAIPPVMGWVACTGGMDPGAWLLGALLYSWQFPHFNALSWNLRPDYSRGGYRMASVIDPELCKRVALRHSVGIVGLCTLAPLANITTLAFIPVSLPLNGYCAYLAWNFYRKGDSNSSRKLFRFSLIHIPALLGLMLLCKKRTKPEDKQICDTEVSNSIT